MKRRIIDIIVSIIAGIAIWAYVVSVLDPVSAQTIKAVPVQLTNTESLASSGLAIAGTGEYTVDVVITANRSTINGLSTNDFVATADLTGLSKGQNYITVNVIAPSNVTVTEVRTQSIQVYLDTLVSVEKTVKIDAQNVSTGQELGAIKMSENVVTVSGAQSLVEAVADVKTVVDVSDMKLDELVTFEYNLVPVNADGERVLGVKLSSNSIFIDSALYNVKEVALNVPIEGELNEHISVRSEIIPASVSIKGPSNILAEVWQIDAEPIDKSSVTESGSIPLKLILPEGVEKAWASEKLSVDYELKGRVDKPLSLSVDNIIAENLPVKYKIASLKDFDVTFSVYEDEVDQFDLSMVSIKIDFSGATGGESSYSYELVIDEAMEDVLVVSAPESANIELTDANSSI